jgi:predicted transcriptional regulator
VAHRSLPGSFSPACAQSLFTSQLNFISAHELMEPFDQHELDPKNLAQLPQVGKDTMIKTMLEIASDTDAPIVVTDGKGTLGVITKNALLRSLKIRL